jgi:hypothetical protein
MSKRDQIEQALLRMEGGRFHRLGDAYLRKLGYHGVNPLGRALGTDKVATGTPDTWIAQPDGRFIFAEYTTISRAKLASKLEEDLDKCLDERKTGIPIGLIQEIFFLHTSVLAPADERALLMKAERHGVRLTTIGLGPITHDLHDRFPVLALEYLGVEVDTGQVLAPSDFVEVYGRNELATPLDTAFQGRGADVDDVLHRLQTGNLLVVSGRAGVGKTRLVLEAFRRFTEANPGWTVRCILNRNRDLFNDLRAHLTPPGKYLILVDDANRVSGFEYVLHLLQERKPGLDIKVVATVRDYARDKVELAVRSYGRAAIIELAPLSSDEIKDIVRAQYGILNHQYLERISEISKGNPRLAVMAARVAAEENTLASIEDVTSLYDRYYASVRDELGEAFGEHVLLRVAGVISILRTVDKSHVEQMDQISDTFGIAADVFWGAAQRLHEMELVDMYEDEVVRISDQVLATYLVYLAAFVRRGVLDLGALIRELFPKHRYRLMDALHGVLSAFHAEMIVSQLRPHVQTAIAEADSAGDEDRILHLVDAFWFASPTDALVIIQARLATLEVEPRGPALSLVPQTAQGSIPEGSLLHALGQFRYAGESMRSALDLLLDYAAKRPSDLPHVVSLLVGRYGYRHTSHMEEYHVENAVVDALVERIRTDTDELFVHIFCAVAKDFLRTRFHVSETRDANYLSVYEFNLVGRADVSEMRAKIWIQLLALARSAHRARVTGVLHHHATGWQDVTVPGIVAKDATHVLPFIESDLDPRVFEDCVVAHAYLDLLDRREVPYPTDLRDRFQNELYTLSELLDPSREKRAKIEYQDYARWWNARIRDHFSGASVEDYSRFFSQAVVLVSKADDRKAAHLRFSVEGVLAELAGRDAVLFVEVIDRYLAEGNQLLLGRITVPAALISEAGPERAFEILTAHEYNGRRRWLFDYYQVLPPEHADAERAKQLLALFHEAEPADLPYSLEFLKQYVAADPQIFVRVADTLIKKAGVQPEVGRAFESLFNSHGSLVLELPALFKGREELIERAYLLMQFNEPHSDYGGVGFDLLLDLNPYFGRTYVEWAFERHASTDPYPTSPDPRDDNRRYDFIWRRDDYASVMNGIVDCVYQLERARVTYESYISRFFAVHADDEDDSGSREPIVVGRQDGFIAELISRRADDIDFVAWLFGTISGFSPERRVRALAAFLEHNRNFSDFARLSLDPKSWSASGSFVPVYQKRVEVLQSFLPLLTGVKFLQHRKRIEGEIDSYRKMIDSEKKRNFMYG